MVMSPESKEQSRLRSQLEGMDVEEDIESVEEEPKQPIYWKESSPVRLNSLSLNPEMFNGNYEYRSGASKKSPEGNITITDEDFVRYRIGALLAPIEEKVEELIATESIDSYLTESIAFYRLYLEEREAAHRESQKGVILDKASKYCKRYKGMLIAANPQMSKWSDEKLISWVADNMQV